MGRILALAAAALLVASTQAQAFCRDDLKDMEPRLQRLKTTNKERYGLASKWFGLALEYEPVSEAQCLTYYLRAQKAMNDPLIQVNDCAGPNAYLPRCNNGGLPAGGPAYAPPGLGPIGGGGGGGGAIQPNNPAVQPTFKPPQANGSQ